MVEGQVLLETSDISLFMLVCIYIHDAQFPFHQLLLFFNVTPDDAMLLMLCVVMDDLY